MFLQILLLWLFLGIIFWFSQRKALPVVDRRLQFPLVINAFLLALGAGNLMWLSGSGKDEVFSDFIGGFLAMAAMPKTFEYHSFYVGIAVFLTAFLLLKKLYGNFRKQEDISAVYEISLFALIIPALMIGQCFITAHFSAVFQSSAISAGCGLIVVAAKWLYPKLQHREMKILLLSIFFGVASCFCIVLFCNRICRPPEIMWIYPVVWIAALYVAIHRKAWNKFLIISQCGLPLAFGNLLMPLQYLRNGELFASGVNGKLNLVVMILILAGYLALYKVFRHRSGTLQKFIPSLPLAALLCLFCAAPDKWGTLSFDDYHNGELVLPWFLYQKFGCHIYVDYMPSRGIINYVPGFLLWFFKGHDFSYISTFIKWADLPLYFLALTVMRRRCPLPVIFAGCAGVTVLTPFISAGVLAGLVGWAWLSDPKWRKKPSLMLLGFFVTGLLGMFYSLTDTATVYVAMLPQAFYMLFLAWKNERRRLLLTAGTIILFSVILMSIPLCRKILLGIFEVLILQSDTYTAAHCVPLMKQNVLHFNVYYVVLNYGFLLLTVIFALRLFFRSKDDSVSKNIHWFAGSSLVILGVIMIQRAGGRAGCEPVSRVILLTFLLLVFALPVWYRDWCRKKISVPLVLILSLLSGTCGNYANSFHSLEEKCRGLLFEPENTVDPQEAGLPHLGRNTVLQAEHFQHHVQARNLISSILPDFETAGGFWDLTNNSAIYAYCGNGIKPPMSYPAYFYVASLPLAEKMSREVEKADPVLVLISGKNIEFYEGNIALRSYPLYKLLMKNYRVFSDVNGKIWMIRKGHEELLKKSPLVKMESLGDQDLLSKALDYKTIDGYPLAWGASMDTLKEKLSDPLEVPGRTVDLNNTMLYAPVGVKRDFLYLKFNRPVKSKWVAVMWEDEFGGKGKPFIAFWGGRREFLVPLFASSNWYAGNLQRNLVVRHENNTDDQLQIEKAVFYGRKDGKSSL